MRKVIGFKLALKVRDVQRRAKKAQFSLAAAGLDESELEFLLREASKSLKPGVLFETFAHPDPDQPLLSPIPGLAYSLVLVTLGEGLRDLKEKDRADNPARLPVWSLAEESALEEGLRFATSLIEEEAAKDSCELSPITSLSEPTALECVLKKVDGSKIGMRLSDGKLAPPASLACSLSWLSKSKARGKPK